VDRLFEGSMEVWSLFALRWWKDIVAIDDLVGVNWYNNLMARKVGNGGNTSFGGAPLPFLSLIFIQF